MTKVVRWLALAALVVLLVGCDQIFGWAPIVQRTSTQPESEPVAPAREIRFTDGTTYTVYSVIENSTNWYRMNLQDLPGYESPDYCTVRVEDDKINCLINNVNYAGSYSAETAYTRSEANVLTLSIEEDIATDVSGKTIDYIRVEDITFEPFTTP